MKIKERNQMIEEDIFKIIEQEKVVSVTRVSELLKDRYQIKLSIQRTRPRMVDLFKRKQIKKFVFRCRPTLYCSTDYDLDKIDLNKIQQLNRVDFSKVIIYDQIYKIIKENYLIRRRDIIKILVDKDEISNVHTIVSEACEMLSHAGIVKINGFKSSSTSPIEFVRSEIGGGDHL